VFIFQEMLMQLLSQLISNDIKAMCDKLCLAVAITLVLRCGGGNVNDIGENQ
jgi:hypothetical protein